VAIPSLLIVTVLVTKRGGLGRLPLNEDPSQALEVFSTWALICIITDSAGSTQSQS
jgi:hypothetical protein